MSKRQIILFVVPFLLVTLFLFAESSHWKYGTQSTENYSDYYLDDDDDTDSDRVVSLSKDNYPDFSILDFDPEFNPSIAINGDDEPFEAPQVTTGNVQVPFEAGETGKAESPVLEPTEKVIEGPVINFNNVGITEFLRFVSRLTGKNFIFDPQELQFPVTIISETPATLDNIMAALMHNLRIHNFYLIEEGNNFIIHKNSDVRAPGGLAFRDKDGRLRPDIATEVFLISNVAPGSVSSIIQAMTTDEAVVSVVEGSSSIVVTDLVANIKKVAEILKKLDIPNIGLDIGQYVALNNSPAALISVASRILGAIAGEKTLLLVPYQTSNSVFIVSTPFLVEKALSVMQALDMNITKTGLLNIDELKFDADSVKQFREEKEQVLKEKRDIPIPLTQDEIDILTEREKFDILSAKGFTPEDVSRLSAQQINRIIREKGLSPREREEILGTQKDLFQSELPLGQVESTQFLIHKLQFRAAESVTDALQAIAASLLGSSPTGGKEAEQTRSDLVVTLNSVQKIEENNSIVFTGTRATLQKVKELINQIDVPVRQVFIEGLILDTNLQESLNFGVEWATKLQRKNFAGQTGLIQEPSKITSDLANIDWPPTVETDPPSVLSPIPLSEGFSVNGIGRKIRHHGKGFYGIAGFINLLRTDNNTEVILNPKIVTEHNVQAELFVGAQVPIKGQSIVNSTSNNATNTVSTNYNTQSVGVTLKVTPLISSSDMVTLIIEQIISNTNAVTVQAQGLDNAPPATIQEIRSTTRVHMPSDHFLMMSGILQTTKTTQTDKFPILGNIPIIGFLFSNNVISEQKRNVIMYLRPKILDTNIDIENITEKEETKFKESSSTQSGVRGNLNDLKTIFQF